MATAPYFDQKLSKDQTKNMLTRQGAKHLPARSQKGIMVYEMSGGGEAMVEPTTDKSLLRVRLFKGRCAC